MVSAISPISVAIPVLITKIRALPPTTEVPMNTALVASESCVAVLGKTPGCFSTGNASPVKVD